MQVAQLQNKLNSNLSVAIHHSLSDVIVIDSYPNNLLDLNKRNKEVIVDANCGAAILRGANVFGPGVMAMPKGNLKYYLSPFEFIIHYCKLLQGQK